jgi:hypothetical protein
MTASAWNIYNEAKKYILNGTIDLDTNTLKLKICGSASNASTFTLSTFASINTEASGGGYVANGKALTGVVISSIISAKSYSLDCTAVIFTASGANLTLVKYAVIGISGGKAIAWSKLTTTQITVTSGNTLTITPDASGIFSVA